MIIATYHTDNTEVAPNRRWIAQIEKTAGRFFVTFHGGTESEARTKAEKFVASIPVKKVETAPEAPIPVIDAAPRRRRTIDEDDVL